MRCSINLQLWSAHEKPQQPNRFDSPTDPEVIEQTYLVYEIDDIIFPPFIFIHLIIKSIMNVFQNLKMILNACTLPFYIMICNF